MVETRHEILDHAVARNAAAVISLPEGGALHHHKTRFLGSCADGVWLESVATKVRQIERLIGSAEVVGVSFRGEPHRVAFCSRILRLDRDFRINSDHAVVAILLAAPAQITPIQRRGSYRVPVPLDTELRLRLWCVPDHVYIKDRPLPSQEVPCHVRNLSVGGVGVMMQPKNERAVRPAQGERVRVELAYRDINFVVEGRVRHPEQAPDDLPPGGFYAGVQFARMDNNLEGRQTLASINSIIGELERDEVKRARGEGN